MENVYFKNIRNAIIQELSLAKESIKIAVAWFTNEELFNKILEKREEGLEIELIIIDDYINNGEYGLDFMKLIELGGKLYYSQTDSPIHHKFCIIDNHALINGSYNWTYYAESKNLENIIIIKDKDNIVNQYIKEFTCIKSTLDPRKTNIKRKLTDAQFEDSFTIKEYLAFDLYFKGKESKEIKHLESSSRLIPTNEFILSEYKSMTEEKITKKTTTSLGIEAIINKIDGKFSIMIDKNTPVPFSKSSTYLTASNNQVVMHIKTYKGDNDLVTNDYLIGSILITDLPPKPAGQATVTVTFDLSEKGDLTVSAKNDATGNEMKAVYNVDNIVF